MKYQQNWLRLWTIKPSILVTLAAILLFFTPVQAQEAASTPAYLALSGDLYQWTPGENTLQATPCDLAGNKALRIALSPLGTHLAINVVSEAVFTGGYAPSPSGNLWICDLRDGTITVITEFDVLSETISRVGTWSPDGMQLAWGKPNDEDDGSAAIFTYDLATRTTTRIIESTPLDYGCGVGPRPPGLAWGENGIAIGYFISSETSPCTAQSLGIYVYTATGDQIADLPVSDTGEDFGLQDIAWDGEMGDRLIFWQRDVAGWKSVTLDGVTATISGTPEQYVPAAGETSPTISWVLQAEGNRISQRFTLPGFTPEQAFEPAPSYGEAFNIGFSPDGTAGLFQIQDGLYGVMNGDITLIDPGLAAPELFESGISYTGNDITWTPLHVRVSPDTVATQAICPSVPSVSYRDRIVRVIEGAGVNNLRIAPLLNADLIGEIPEGADAALMFIADVCSEGIRWRNVMYEGLRGWTAESQGDAGADSG